MTALNANRSHSIPARKADMRSDSGAANITSKIIAAVLSLLLLLFSLAGPMGVITSAYAGTAGLAETKTSPRSALIPQDCTATPTDPSCTQTPSPSPSPSPTPSPSPSPTPSPTLSPTPTKTPKPTPTRTPRPTPTTATGFLPTPGITPSPSSTATPLGTGTVTATPSATGADQTPTSTATAVPVTNNNDGTPPGNHKGGGLPVPFILFMTSALLILGMVSVIAFVFLRMRGSLSPVPQAKLPSSGARPWSRWRGHSLHENTNMNGIPFIVEGERAAYNSPFLPGPGGIAANNQPQVPFGYTLPPANWGPGSAPTNIPQALFSDAPTQSIMPQNSFLQQEQGSGPIRFRAAGDNNTAPDHQSFPTQNMQPPPRSSPSDEQLRRLAQQRLIVPPDEPQNEDWIR
jgi:hypothetical protein